MAMVISESELLEALASSLSTKGAAEARTLRDLQRETGIGDKRLRRALCAMQDDGLLELHWVRRDGLNGRPQLVPAYALKQKSPKKSPRKPRR